MKEGRASRGLVLPQNLGGAQQLEPDGAPGGSGQLRVPQADRWSAGDRIGNCRFKRTALDVLTP